MPTSVPLGPLPLKSHSPQRVNAGKPPKIVTLDFSSIRCLGLKHRHLVAVSGIRSLLTIEPRIVNTTALIRFSLRRPMFLVSRKGGYYVDSNHATYILLAEAVNAGCMHPDQKVHALLGHRSTGNLQDVRLLDDVIEPLLSSLARSSEPLLYERLVDLRFTEPVFGRSLTEKEQAALLGMSVNKLRRLAKKLSEGAGS